MPFCVQVAILAYTDENVVIETQKQQCAEHLHIIISGISHICQSYMLLEVTHGFTGYFKK